MAANYRRKLRGERMDEQTLKTIVQHEIYSATGSLLGSDGGGDLSDRRRQALEYYYGEPFGTEVEGRSQFISTDVHDAVEGMLPALLAPFTSSDDIVRFEPMGREDEEPAKQATEYINHIFYNDNPGFDILYDWVKDGLIQKNGIVKVWWEEKDHEDRKTLTNLSDEEVAYILAGEGVEPVEHSDNPDGTHDLTILKTEPRGRCRIMGVPPEEFLIARRATNSDTAPFLAHRTRKSISELIEEGYDPEVLESIPSYDEAEYNEERLARFESDDEWPIDANQMDPAMRHVWVYECYITTDYDGDGVAELRKVTVAGPGYDILDNEPVDEQPFVDWTPIPLPHKFFGLSIADETMDIQKGKSAVLRQVLDNMYFINSNRMVVNDRIDIDQLLTNRPSAIAQAKGQEPVTGSFEVIQPQSIVQHGFPILEYFDTIREARTGVTRYNQGMDADSLNKTATGIARIMSASQKRMQLFARVFAETGLKRLMSKILRLAIKNQDKERVIRLRNEWVPIDPRSWNAEMDVTITVGLGYGTKESHLFAAQRLLEIQQQIVAFQGGAEGPLVTPEHIYNGVATFLQAMELKGVEKYVQDPTSPDAQAPEPRPDPEVVKAKMEADDKEKDRQQEDRHHRDEMWIKWNDLKGKYDLEGDRFWLEWQKANAEVGAKNAEMDFKEREFSGSEAGKSLSRLEGAEQSGQIMLQGLEQLMAQIENLKATLQEPKSITPRYRGDKLVGASVKQGDVETYVEIEGRTLN